MFLSHKRSSAQHIAGRLWEGFKDRYSVFLDSEAQFQVKKNYKFSLIFSL